jgi:hypothetical protein
MPHAIGVAAHASAKPHPSAIRVDRRRPSSIPASKKVPHVEPSLARQE